jgi:ureidoglycolate dehydrogenase (NAD+)
MSDLRVSAALLREFCRDVFVRCGLTAPEAVTTADNLLFANLRGVDSHGVIRLKVYCDRLRAGSFKRDAKLQWIGESPSTALLDGQAGMGAVVGQAAMAMALAKASASGLGYVAVRNSNHFGACAFYALQAVERGCIGFAATNAGPSMAPSGGCERRLGNNAFGFAIPAGRHAPIVLDMATGAVAWGKIFLAQQEKKKIPVTWALDKYGVPTDDPDVAAQGGLIQPMAGYKGYGLCLLIDLLTGVLAGGAFANQVRTLYDKIGDPTEVAHCFGALRIASFMPENEFLERVDLLIDLMHQCPAAPGVESILVPGEIEHATAQRRSREGIPINATLAKELRELAVELNLPALF